MWCRDLDSVAGCAVNLPNLVLSEFWHERHNDCTLHAECRAMCVLLAIADAVAPEGEAALAHVRAVLLADVR